MGKGSIRSFFRRYRLRRKSVTALQQSAPSSPSTTTTTTTTSSSSDLHRVFEKFDSNGDGRISASELSAIFESLGNLPSPSELESMMSEADSDKDGFISLEEFIELNTRGVDETDMMEDLRNAFSVFDLDRNGLISADELASVLKSLGEGASIADCRKMIGGVDRDGDGMICFDEFKAMMGNGNGNGATLFSVINK